MATIATASFHFCQLAAPHIEANGGGAIVIVSSIAAVTGHQAEGPVERGQALSY
jgi:NAD(P)-dependent dehydrogenase (short-subunit alcohol dehydrogenase family)